MFDEAQKIQKIGLYFKLIISTISALSLPGHLHSIWRALLENC